MRLFELSMDVTHNCPFSCPFCSSPDNTSLPNIDLDTVLACLDFLGKLSNLKTDQTIISITGGEPLTLEELPLLMSVCSQRVAAINLCTTAAIYKENKYWRELHSYGLETLFLSLHSVSKDKCLATFGNKYDFSSVDRNVELIVDAGITINANFLITRLSISSFDKVCQYCVKKSIKKVRVLELCKQGRAARNWSKIAISRQDRISFVEYASKVCSEYSLEVEFTGLPNYKRCSHSNENNRCLGGNTFFHINTDGDVYPCPSVKSIKSERIGSVFYPQRTRVGRNRLSCLSRR